MFISKKEKSKYEARFKSINDYCEGMMETVLRDSAILYDYVGLIQEDRNSSEKRVDELELRVRDLEVEIRTLINLFSA